MFTGRSNADSQEHAVYSVTCWDPNLSELEDRLGVTGRNHSFLQFGDDIIVPPTEAKALLGRNSEPSPVVASLDELTIVKSSREC